MRILYGVQATGQGHISRARALAEAFEHHPEVDVTWLFSGRARDKLFDMEPFGNFQHRRGLTFVTEAGRLRYRKTAFSNNLFRFFQDVRRLQLDAYDLIAETRLDHQVRQVKADAKPDNYLPPSDLSDFERSHLRDAFVVVKTMQSAVGHGKGMLG